MQPHRSSALDGGWCCRCSDSGMDAHTCCGRATVMWPWSHIILRAARERPAPAFVDTLGRTPYRNICHCQPRTSSVDSCDSTRR